MKLSNQSKWFREVALLVKLTRKYWRWISHLNMKKYTWAPTLLLVGEVLLFNAEFSSVPCKVAVPIYPILFSLSSWDLIVRPVFVKAAPTISKRYFFKYNSNSSYLLHVLTVWSKDACGHRDYWWLSWSISINMYTEKW